MKQIKKIFKYLKNILLKKKDNTIETIFVNKLYLARAKTKNKFIQNNFFQTFKSTGVDIEFNKRMLKFRENNPEFNFYFFDDIEMDEYMEKNWSHRKIYKIYKDSIFGASKADIWRYCILFQYGGIYLDFDSSIEFSLSDIPPNVDEVVSFEKNTIESQISREYTPDYNFFTKLPKEHKNVNYPKNLFIQWLLIFKKEHPILRMAIDQIEKNYDFFYKKEFESAHLAIVNFTAPVLLTKVIWDYVLDGNKIFQKGIDYNSQVTFKNISKNGVYFNDDSYYKKYSNTQILFEKPVRLNLGCGNNIKKEFINIDAVKKKENILNIDIKHLKNNFSNLTVDEIYAKNVIEHVGLPTAKKFIKEWSFLLKRGGVITITTPCLDLLIDAFKMKLIDEEKLNYLLFAGIFWKNEKQYWDTEKTTIYDWHKVCFSKNQLKKILNDNEFEIVSERYDEIIKNVNGLNMTIKAKKK